MHPRGNITGFQVDCRRQVEPGRTQGRGDQRTARSERPILRAECLKHWGVICLISHCVDRAPLASARRDSHPLWELVPGCGAKSHRSDMSSAMNAYKFYNLRRVKTARFHTLGVRRSDAIFISLNRSYISVFHHYCHSLSRAMWNASLGL